MTRYAYNTAMTLDGFLADEHDSLAWLFVQDFDENGPQSMTAFMTRMGAIVMGATTYRWLLEHEVSEDSPWPYDVPTFVFTHSTDAPHNDSIRFVAGTPGDHRAALEEAAAGRDVWVVGGGELAAAFARDGMLDDVLVSIAPVTLGAGRPLFGLPYDLALESTDRNGDFVVATYRVLGPLGTRTAQDR